MTAVSKAAIVTGAGSGIGRGVALALLADGYHLGLAGRRLQALEETIQAANDLAPNLGDNLGDNCLAVATDVADPASVANLFAQVAKAFGRLDLLFNNAGIGAPAVPFEDISFADWSAVVNINLTGSFLCAQEAFKVMKAQEPQGGRIINNGSISAHAPRPFSAPYTATKHAITGLTKSTSLDGRAYNIACGQIDIGNAATEMTARMAQGVPQANGTTMIEPTMDADNVARAVVHMASLPLNANVLSMTVMASDMPLVGRG